ncbi:Adenosylmethionine--8-amino-7-oxononanoate transaminase [Thermodesulfobium narugense DSM 14796]|uniref:Adenosylmethionine-8-amino-7-oxononanoate aminotransferase n=1 Tax=Thermodesulfobium narugense DSM 14796 TaxID=747365 RepID=M1E7U9_9BACT|nr:adenosylmethionine--8-amino-7-oxononanoate transaminase [Thermodesulfobium narugense]AEE15431.1 Adenosylmethionine--8-amino-7-oxononanoate transaminase [Thermodesulfobium narugense DSM 14796]
MIQIWHPCTQMKDHEKYPLIKIKNAKGVYLYDFEGNSYIDGISSWWVNLFGHSNERLNRAISNQIASLEQVIFAGFTHERALELAKLLSEVVPDNLSRMFFAEIGSSAVEISLKMSFHYFQNIGQRKRKKFVSLKNGYHGETIGALSVSGEDLYKKAYKNILPKNIVSPSPDCYRCKFGYSRETCNTECFSDIEKILMSNSEKICAVIVEPLVQFAGGFKIYPAEYLVKLRNLTSELGIHLILDEIATGFGRTGKMFACEWANVKPDFMCLSKGITSGYLPLSVVLTTEEVYKAFYDDYITLKAFLHSHSYNGNAISSAVAVETLKIFKEENVLEKNKEKYKYMRSLIEDKFCELSHVGEIRHIGFISAVEIVENKKTKKPFNWKRRIGFNIYREALKRGALLRNLGDIIYFLPPYIIEPHQIEALVEAAHQSYLEVLNR